MTSTERYSNFARGAVADLKQHIDEHPLEYKTVTDLWKARPPGIRSMIEKAFKPITGYRIKEYLVLVRLELSKQDLKNGVNIKRVALKYFYKSQSAYCTAFKRHFNQNPTDWLNDAPE